MTQFTVKRIGECNMCGTCCPPACLHLKDKKCLIHANKKDYCEECRKDHEVCTERPDLPNGVPNCGYKFISMIRGKERVIVGLRYGD